VREDLTLTRDAAQGEGREVVPVETLTKDALEAAIKANKLPLTIEFNQANSDKIFGAGIPRHILMLAKEADLAPTAPAMKMLREVSTAYKGKFVFVTVNADSADSEPVVKFFELDKEVSPSVVGFVVRVWGQMLGVWVSGQRRDGC